MRAYVAQMAQLPILHQGQLLPREYQNQPRWRFAVYIEQVRLLVELNHERRDFGARILAHWRLEVLTAGLLRALPVERPSHQELLRFTRRIIRLWAEQINLEELLRLQVWTFIERSPFWRALFLQWRLLARAGRDRRRAAA